MRITCVRPHEGVQMKPHECKPARTCRCSQTADEPNENCPVHGYADDRRCGICGRWLTRALAPPEGEPR